MVVPKFNTEAEEAQWWFDNREKVEDALIRAMDTGTHPEGEKTTAADERR